MKKIFNIMWLFAISMMLIVTSGCEEVIMTQEPQVSEVTVQEVGQNSVTLAAEFFDGGHQFADVGFCYNTIGAPTVSDLCYSFGQVQEELAVTIDGLDDATTYYVKAYAKSASGIVFYSEESAVFTTVFKMEPISGINNIIPYGTSAVIESFFDYDENAEIVDMGLIINTEKDPVGATAKKISFEAERNFITYTCDDLLEETSYYVWSYIETQECGVMYSKENAFSTRKMISIEQKEFSSTYFLTGLHRATFTCTIDYPATDNATIADVGMIWSKNPNVEYSAQGVEQFVDPRIKSSGVYTICITGLTGKSTYYFRTFIRLSTGEILYSDELQVLTGTNQSSMLVDGSYAEWNKGSATQNRYWQWYSTSSYTTDRQKNDPVWGIDGMREAFKKQGYSFDYSSTFKECYYWHFTINKQGDTTLMLHFQYNDYPRTTESGTQHRALFAWKVKNNLAKGQILCTDMVYENSSFPTTTETGVYWQKAKILYEGEHTGPMLKAFFEFLFGTKENPHPLQLDVNGVKKSDASCSTNGFILMPINRETNPDWDYLRIQAWGTFNNMPLPQWSTSNP